MASDEKRSAVEECLGLFESAILWVPLDEMERERLRGEVSTAREELRALRHEAYMSRCRGDVLAETNESLRELLVDVFDLWDDDVIEHSTPDNYARAQTVFDRILAVLPPEKQAAILGRRTP